MKSYQAWEPCVPEVITKDSLWKLSAYRFSLYLSDLAWEDVTRLMRDSRTRRLSDQLYRAVGSVGANIAEGYSRGSGRDRARFYEYALGSARESRDWYYKSRRTLGDDVFENRTKVLSEIIRLLLTMVPQQRGTGIREDREAYKIQSKHVTPV